MDKQIFIHAPKLLDVGGESSIPTAVYYGANGKIELGSAALDAAGGSGGVLTDFKVQLGEVDRLTSARRTPFLTISGSPKSAVDLANDFIRGVVKLASKAIADGGDAPPSSIMVAEPLNLEQGVGSPTWLANYRGHLRQILAACGFTNVEFLPEPFAAFQYYRYGVRHPLVAATTKQNALV